ncbi:MAG TPA: transglutaminase domain-containing protein [Kofleriaceae bacterium]|nr:transglutaminase domain-containing protein [Kofleriaceae bacterium]
MRAVLLALIAGCARPTALPADVPTETPHDATRHYTIWLGGSRVGTAVESERWSRDGVHLHREEHLAFLRGDADIQLATSIDIDADPALVAHKVRWSERTGRDERAAEALRAQPGWQVSTGEQLAQNAVPAELVPLLVRRDGSFSGTVFLPARGFVAGSGRVEPVAPGRLVARVALDAGPVVEATIDLDRDGSPARIVDGEGVIAIRVTESQAAESFPTVDLIAATAVAITGRRHAARIRLDGNLALPALPGQQARPVPDGVSVDLDPALTGALPPGPSYPDRSNEIAALVVAVRRRITPDLGAARATSRDAAAATAGDCTTFALAYAALATRRAIPTRVVTGLRIDGTRLLRHRWAVSWTGTRWIAIDAAFGAVPAGGNLIGLAVHGADDAGLVAGEAALTQVRSATWD